MISLLMELHTRLNLMVMTTLVLTVFGSVQKFKDKTVTLCSDMRPTMLQIILTLFLQAISKA